MKTTMLWHVKELTVRCMKQAWLNAIQLTRHGFGALLAHNESLPVMVGIDVRICLCLPCVAFGLLTLPCCMLVGVPRAAGRDQIPIFRDLTDLLQRQWLP